MLVSKLRGARDRKRATGAKVEGRRTHQELRPEVVAIARQLRSQKLSLNRIAAELAAQGHLSAAAKPFTPQSIKNMIEA